MTNSNYGRIVNGEIVYAPAQIVNGNSVTTNPTESQYLAAGYYPLAHNQPLAAAADGHHWEHANWQVVDNQIVEDWTQVADAPVVRVFTPLSLIRVLTIVGQWATVRAALKAGGEEVYEQFITAIELREDDPVFAQFLGWARQQFGETMLDRMIDAAAQGTEYVNGLTAEDFAVEVTNG